MCEEAIFNFSNIFIKSAWHMALTKKNQQTTKKKLQMCLLALPLFRFCQFCVPPHICYIHVQFFTPPPFLLQCCSPSSFHSFTCCIIIPSILERNGSICNKPFAWRKKSTDKYFVIIFTTVQAKKKRANNVVHKCNWSAHLHCSLNQIPSNGSLSWLFLCVFSISFGILLLLLLLSKLYPW